MSTEARGAAWNRAEVSWSGTGQIRARGKRRNLKSWGDKGHCEGVIGLVSPPACCWEEDQHAGYGPCCQDNITGSARRPAQGVGPRLPSQTLVLSRGPTRAPLRPRAPCPLAAGPAALRSGAVLSQVPHPHPVGLFGLHRLLKIILRIRKQRVSTTKRQPNSKMGKEPD